MTRLNVLFKTISVIGRWEGDTERLCAIEPRSRLKKIFVSSWDRTCDRKVSKPALNLLNNLGSQVGKTSRFSYLPPFSIMG